MLLTADSKMGQMLINHQQNGFFTNDVLTKDATETIQGEIVKVAEDKVNGIADLRNAGVAFQVTGGLGTLNSVWQRQSTLTGATRAMDPRSLSQKDRLTYDYLTVPLPVSSKQFELGIRDMMAGTKEGLALVAQHSNLCATKVLQDLDKLVFKGDSALGIEGYTTATNRNTVDATADWSDPANNATIIIDISSAVDLLYLDNYEGPYDMYVASNIWKNMNLDYSADKVSGTLLSRILALPTIRSVKPSRFLADGEAIMVQLTSDVVDLAVAQDIRNFTLVDNGLVLENYIMASMTPRVKHTKEGQSGICHITA